MSITGRTAPEDSLLVRLLKEPRLGTWIVALGVGLTLPSLFIGFHLDDLIGRFIFSDLPGAERLYRIYAGGYGAANGDPADAAWMMEEGFAPWWMDPEVLLAFFRPVSLATHLLDAELWPDSAFMWHAHSLLWFAVLLIAATSTYRRMQGPVIGGLAALLFAVDHTHGLPVGFITNRYILIATAFAVLALREHHRFRAEGTRQAMVLATGWYALALLAGESSAAIVGYLVAYAWFLDAGSLRSRALSLLPYFATTVVWRIVYNTLGRGAHGSDLYIDPAREPLRFLAAVFERAPMLLLGQWFAPPAETYTMADAQTARWLIAFSWAFAVLLFAALWPLLRRDKMARFWATGMVLAVIPMCSGEPNNRMLFVAGFGAMGLLAQWWHMYAVTLRAAWRSLSEKLSRAVGVVMMVGHLLLSPLVLPLAACSLLVLEPLKASFADVGAEAAGREAVFVTSPDYFAVRLMRMSKEVEGEPTPQRWRALAYGPEQVTVERVSERTLELHYEGGAMGQPAVTKQALDLYRSRAVPMHEGQQVVLGGLTIEVLEVTPDGRPLRARFEFEDALDAPRYRFYHWVDNHFRPFDVPKVGERRVLPPAVLVPELPGFGEEKSAAVPDVSAASVPRNVYAACRDSGR